jgi:hypothetical protein
LYFCTADLQSAVSPICNRLVPEKAHGAGKLQTSDMAGYKSALPQRNGDWKSGLKAARINAFHELNG